MIAFTEDGLSLDVRVDAEKETVWLTQAEMAELFGVDRTRITRHINNICDAGEIELESNVRKTHFANSDRPTTLYALDMVLAVGYRVNSKRGIAFRRWANTVLRQYLIEGYALNERRLTALNRTVEVQRALLAHYAEGAGADADEVIEVLDRSPRPSTCSMTMTINASLSRRKAIGRSSTSVSRSASSSSARPRSTNGAIFLAKRRTKAP